MTQWQDAHFIVRAGYRRALERGERVCTIAGMLDTEAYTLYCREMFQNHLEELRRLAPDARDLDLIDFLQRG